MRRGLLVAILVALAAVPSGAPRSTVAKLLLGVAGDPARMQSHTGQQPGVRSLFLGWGHGQTYGAPIAKLLEQSGPVPMIHIGILGQTKKRAITPLQIAQGMGDSYLAALNQGIAAYGGLMYVRPLAEMNNYKVAYAAFTQSGRSRGPAFAPAAYRKAFARMFVILHGASVGRKLASLGLPAYKGGALANNPASRLQVIWNPLSGGQPAIPANAPEVFYPGDGYVDLVGNDMYAEGKVFSRDANEALYRFARARGKPYSFPEWGIKNVDEPALAQYLCDFIRAKAAIVLAAYFEARRPSPYDLGPKPKVRQVYRGCITPLWAQPPARPPQTPPGPAEMRLTADPASGPAPLGVAFTTFVNLPQPVVRWQLAFGDGQVEQGNGLPPDQVAHEYAKDGVYQAVLIVYLAPPFTGTAIRLLTQTTVTVGEDSGELLALTPTPKSGKAPLKVVFRTTTNMPRPVVRWQLLYGDGLQVEGTGKPTRFLGHTYTRKGRYRAILIVYLAPPFTGTAVRFLTYADVVVR